MIVTTSKKSIDIALNNTATYNLDDETKKSILKNNYSFKLNTKRLIQQLGPEINSGVNKQISNYLMENIGDFKMESSLKDDMIQGTTTMAITGNHANSLEFFFNVIDSINNIIKKDKEEREQKLNLMSKKKWLLFFLCILFLAGYWKFFYKTYSETAVAKSADCIIALDVKRVTNTVIWNLLTTPSQWKKISYSRSGKLSWKDMVKIPDYVFVFHSAGQPGNAWYSLLEIKDETDFTNGLLQYHFEKGDSLLGQQSYFLSGQGIVMIRSGNKLLVGNNAIENKNYIRQVANEMFVQKQFVGREKLFKNVETGSHLSILIEKNNLLQEDAVIKINFDKKKISIDALFSPQKQFTFTENSFNYPADALCSAGFVQPSSTLYSRFPQQAKINISKAINFNIDSMLLQSNHYYDINIMKIAPRIDSAISYVYDDNFNQVEKVVVNNVMEPSYSFNIQGDSISNIYNYWNNNGQLEKATAGDLFLPMPFAKSYCVQKNKNELSVSTTGFENKQNIRSTNCMLFFKLLLTKIPAELLKYLPADLRRSIANLESIEMILKKAGGNIKLEGRVNKKENDLPVLNF